MKTEDTGTIIAGTVVCKKCDAINAGGAHLCGECGAVLEKSRPMHEHGEREARRKEAADALRHAYKWINAVTWLYWLGAVAYALATLFAFMALARVHVPLGPGVLVVALTTTLSVLMVMGAVHILFKPFLWTVVIAVLATAVTVVHFVGPNPFGVAGYASAAWALVAWGALWPTFRFRELIVAHTDLYALHHASRRTKRGLEGHFAKERHERLTAAMAKAYRRAWRLSATIAGTIAVVSLVCTTAVVTQLRPQEFEPAQAEFEAGWERAGWRGVESLFDPDARETQITWLTGASEAHGWRRKLPPLGEGTLTRSGTRAQVDYEVAGLPMSTRWFLDGQTWRISEVELPVPPFDPVFERFTRAWKSSNPPAIAAFFSPDVRAKMVDSISSAAEARGWKSYPEIKDLDRMDTLEGDVIMKLSTAHGEVVTEWHVRPDGTWGLHGLRFPKYKAKR
jgi:hypothetical protein